MYHFSVNLFNRPILMRFLTFSLLFLSIHFSFSQDFNFGAIPKELLNNSNAVYRWDEIAVKVNSIDKMEYTIKKVVTVLNKHGNRHANLGKYFDEQTKITNIGAVIYDSFGNKIDQIKKNDFSTRSAVDGFSLYLDDKLMYYNYTPIQYPYTIEFECQIETSDTGAVPQWYFLSGYLTSVEYSKYTITYPSKKFRPNIKEKNLDGFELLKTEKFNNITYEARNIQSIKKEELCPSFNEIAPILSVRLPEFSFKGIQAKVNSWKEMGDWINEELLKGRLELSQGTIETAKSLVRDIDDDLEKAKIIYSYVQDNTRYISVQVGIGGFQPISAIEVDKVKYGDCKGLSNYTRALLSAVEVESYYVHVEAGDEKIDFEDDFPDLLQGNHAIVAIPYKGQYYWIDCTSQVHPFGFLGDFTDGRKVLVVKPNESELVTTTSYLNSENLKRTSAKVNLDSLGGLEGTVSVQTQGIKYDQHFYLEGKTKKQVADYYKNYWGNVNNLQLESYSFENDRDSIVFKEKLNIEASNYANKSGERLLFGINPFNKNRSLPKRYRKRNFPFVIQRGFLDEAEFEIKLPEGFDIEAIPQSLHIENEFGTYKVSVEELENANTLLYKRYFLVKHGKFPKEKYKTYREFQKEVLKMDNAQVVLVKTKTN